MKFSSLIKKFPFLKRQNVAEATILMASFLFLSKVIGYFREVLVAKYFGASSQTDAFLVALIIPSSIMGIISTGLSTLIIPIYIEKKKKNPEKAKIFVNQIFLLWSIILLVLSFLIFIFAPFLVKLIAFGFQGQRLDLAILLTRYLTPIGFATVLTGLFIGLFRAERQFLYPTIISIIGNVLVVSCLILFHSLLGINSWTLGRLLYAGFTFFALFWVLWKKKNLFQKFSLKYVNWLEIKEFFFLLFPLILTSSIATLHQIVDKTIASFLPVGAIAVLNFAQRTYTIPLSLLALPLSFAIYPTFSSLALEKEKRVDYSKTLQKALCLSWYIIIPCSILFIALSQPIVKFLFQRGAFTIQDTVRTSLTVSLYSLGLFAHAANYFLNKAFYSFKNTKTPLIISSIIVGINIIASILLSRILGVAGIALATSISSFIGFVLSLAVLHKKYFKFSARRPLAFQAIKTIIACIPLTILSFIFKPYLSANLKFLLLLPRFILVGIILTLVYLFLSYLLNLEGYRIIIEYLKKTLSKYKK